MKRKVLFVLNPVAGGKKDRKSELINEINSHISPENIEHTIKVWERPEQRDEIMNMIGSGLYDVVVAVGGDGTINMVAAAAIKAGVTLGIVPIGSGNGLARHLHIPLKPAEAIALINTGTEITIDSGMVNDRVFMCTSGIGFDALIGDLFASSTRRGFSSYFKITVGQLLSYKPQNYIISFEDRSIERKAFLITIANASQYGNDAFIAPQADIADRHLDICILKPFKLWHIPGLAMRIFRKTITGSPLYETYRVQQAQISRTEDGPIHYDGEPLRLGTQLSYNVNPGALKVIVPEVFAKKYRKVKVVESVM
jgi:YegS/Rv2252/BmrU family lipid kinase